MYGYFKKHEKDLSCSSPFGGSENSIITPLMRPPSVLAQAVLGNTLIMFPIIAIVFLNGDTCPTHDFYPPLSPTKLQEGNVFSRACPSVVLPRGFPYVANTHDALDLIIPHGHVPSCVQLGPYCTGAPQPWYLLHKETPPPCSTCSLWSTAVDIYLNAFLL